jgi:outer membrane protein assembly factor BamB
VRGALLAILLPVALVTACSSGSSTSADTTSPTSSTASTASSAATSSTAAPAVVSWPTFGGTAERRGSVAAGPNPSAITEAWATDQLDGALYGEPVVAGGRVMVATENDSVYAFDVTSGQPAWHVNLGEPIPRSALECGNIDPTGITGTPVIDAGSGTVYVVAFVQPGRHDVVALNTADGSIRWRRPADPPGLDPFHEQQRSALTVANGRVYVAYGGLFGDCGPYKGALVSFALDGSGDPQSWIVPTTREGGLWAPSGITVDASGNLFVSVGNAASTDPSNFDDGNAVVRLTPDLNAVDVWAPKDWHALSARDADLGSVGPVPLDGGRIFVSGKNGVGYVLDGSQLGGVGGELGSAKICDGGAFGGSATNGSVVVVGCSSGPVGLQIGDDATISPRWRGPTGRSGAPIIAGGSVWLVNNNGHLYALDAANGTVQADVALHGRIAGFPTPTVLPTTVLVAAGSRLVAFTG